MARALRPEPFRPAPWIANRHAQTLYAALAAPAPRIEFRRERWDTPDGDFVDVDFVDGPGGTPWVHLFHGLEGSSNSPYARKLMDHVVHEGARVMRSGRSLEAVEEVDPGRARRAVGEIHLDEIAVGRVPALAPIAHRGRWSETRGVDRLQVGMRQPARGRIGLRRHQRSRISMARAPFGLRGPI